MLIGYDSLKFTHAVHGGRLGGHKSAPYIHRHRHRHSAPPLINEDLPAEPQLVFIFDNRVFRHQACYSLLPTGQATSRPRPNFKVCWSVAM
jgi:hypothetical protein